MHYVLREKKIVLKTLIIHEKKLLKVLFNLIRVI